MGKMPDPETAVSYLSLAINTLHQEINRHYKKWEEGEIGIMSASVSMDRECTAFASAMTKLMIRTISGDTQDGA